MRLQTGIHRPQPLGTLLRPRACVIAVLTAISILLSPASAVAEETADHALRTQVLEEAISTNIRASAARELAAARAQAEQELRSLPAGFQRHGSTEADVVTLRDAGGS